MALTLLASGLSGPNNLSSFSTAPGRASYRWMTFQAFLPWIPAWQAAPFPEARRRSSAWKFQLLFILASLCGRSGHRRTAAARCCGSSRAPGPLWCSAWLRFLSRFLSSASPSGPRRPLSAPGRSPSICGELGPHTGGIVGRTVLPIIAWSFEVGILIWETTVTYKWSTINISGYLLRVLLATIQTHYKDCCRCQTVLLVSLVACFWNIPCESQKTSNLDKNRTGWKN